MAERRMFAKSVTESDIFTELPAPAQLLYFHCGMKADDDGFVNGVKSIMRMIDAKQADLQALIDGELLIPFENGPYLIKDWLICNEIKKDRRRPTRYTKEFKAVTILESKQYVLKKNLETNWRQNVSSLEPQYSTGEEREEQDRGGENSPAHPSEGKEIQGKGMVGETHRGKGYLNTTTAPSDDSGTGKLGFDFFFEKYPNKEREDDARREWFCCEPEQEEILAMITDIYKKKKDGGWEGTRDPNAVPCVVDYLKSRQWEKKG
ncbi:MAG: hypothetical protein MJ124_07740 [Lachnospiraceae bacterium]|nr:hypothetical protein [Lachnospiraceae bacterium]